MVYDIAIDLGFRESINIINVFTYLNFQKWHITYFEIIESMLKLFIYNK